MADMLVYLIHNLFKRDLFCVCKLKCKTNGIKQGWYNYEGL